MAIGLTIETAASDAPAQPLLEQLRSGAERLLEEVYDFLFGRDLEVGSVELALAAFVAVLLWRWLATWLARCDPPRVEVYDLINATGNEEVQGAGLASAIRSHLAVFDIHVPTATPDPGVREDLLSVLEEHPNAQLAWYAKLVRVLRQELKPSCRTSVHGVLRCTQEIPMCVVDIALTGIRGGASTYIAYREDTHELAAVEAADHIAAAVLSARPRRCTDPWTRFTDVTPYTLRHFRRALELEREARRLAGSA